MVILHEPIWKNWSLLLLKIIALVPLFPRGIQSRPLCRDGSFVDLLNLSSVGLEAGGESDHMVCAINCMYRNVVRGGT